MLFDPNPLEFPSAWASAWGQDNFGLWQAFELNGVRQVMRWIAPGSFLMGSPEGEPERESDELQHRVTLTQGLLARGVGLHPGALAGGDGGQPQPVQ